MAPFSFYLLFEIAGSSVLHRVVNGRARCTDMTHSEVLVSFLKGWRAVRLESGRIDVFRPAALALTGCERDLGDGRNLIHRLLVTVSLIYGHFSSMNIPWNSGLPTMDTVNATIIDTVQSRMFLFLVGCRGHWSYSVRQTSTKSWHPNCAWDRESRGELARLDWWIGVAICGTSAEEQLSFSSLIVQLGKDGISSVGFGVTLWGITISIGLMSGLMLELATAIEGEVIFILRWSE